MARWAFDFLGIEATKDKKAIKKAYAVQIKKYLQEEQPAQWAKTHEAYEAAMKYAESDDTATNIRKDASYDGISQQTQSQRHQQKNEHEKELSYRMYELMRMKNKNAYAEWSKFFSTEFLPNESIESMRTLLEIARAYPLQSNVAYLIIETMTKRTQYYQTAMELDKASLAADIVKAAQEQLPKQYSETRRHTVRKRRIFPVVIGIAGLIAASLLGVGIMMGKSNSLAKDARIQATVYLNEKYEGIGYTELDLKAEKENVFGNRADKVVVYRIIEDESYATIAYGLTPKGEKEFLFFDNIQEKEIRKAFQERLNELTGRPEGRLYWNSDTGYDIGEIRDGFFHTSFGGDFDAFMEKEDQIRMQAPGTTVMRLRRGSSARNGNCDYYLPDPVIKTMEQRFQMQEVAEDAELQTVLEACGEDYGIQLRGIVLPSMYFESKMKQADWSNDSIYVKENFYGAADMHPTVPFLLMTAWHVSVPSEDKELLGIQNGIYGKNPVLMAEGIYGAENSNSQYVGDQLKTDMTGSIVETEVPESLDLTKAQRQKAISFQMKPGIIPETEYCLAIDKSVYGITDSGYRVIQTEKDEDGDYNRKMYLEPYDDQRADVGYGDAMDGEGYLFVLYERFWEHEEPTVITIVNP